MYQRACAEKSGTLPNVAAAELRWMRTALSAENQSISKAFCSMSRNALSRLAG
jgi:hypothetical protein